MLLYAQLELWEHSEPQGWNLCREYIDVGISLVKQQKFSMAEEVLVRAIQISEQNSGPK